jgi:hypothetical protein
MFNCNVCSRGDGVKAFYEHVQKEAGFTVIEAFIGFPRIDEKEANMLIVRITAILALVYSLSLTAARDGGMGIDPMAER